jgi:hypothetical protein
MPISVLHQVYSAAGIKGDGFPENQGPSASSRGGPTCGPQKSRQYGYQNQYPN